MQCNYRAIYKMSRKLNVFMPSVDLRVSTPFLWHSSEGLTLPHLTVETLEASRILTVAKDSFPDFESGEKCETVDKPPLPILVSLGSLINRRKTLRKYAKGKFFIHVEKPKQYVGAPRPRCINLLLRNSRKYGFL